MPRQWVDVSQALALALCSCGWRDMRSNHMGARAAITEHVRNCHPEHLASAMRAEQRMRSRHA